MSTKLPYLPNKIAVHEQFWLVLMMAIIRICTENKQQNEHQQLKHIK